MGWNHHRCGCVTRWDSIGWLSITVIQCNDHAEQERLAERAVAGSVTPSGEGTAELVADLAAALRAATAAQPQPSRVAELEAENDELHEDLVRFITQRNLALEYAAAEIHPGPDGQDDIERRKLIDRWHGDAWDDVDGWKELAAKGAMVVAERDALRAEVDDLRTRLAAAEAEVEPWRDGVAMGQFDETGRVAVDTPEETT